MISMTSNISAFLSGLALYKVKTDAEIGNTLKEVARKLVPRLMSETPKKTHRAASGFITAAVNLKASWAGIVSGPGVNQGKTEGRYIDGTKKVGTKFIEFSNIVPYIGILESSHPSAAGFVTRNVAQANAELKAKMRSAVVKWW